MEPTLFDYDLNIYHVEEAFEGDDGTESWEYTDQWYVDIYEYLDRDQMHVAGPFHISPLQRDALLLGQEGTYFEEDDSWYGLTGFLQAYKDNLTSELTDIFDALPKVKEEVLF